MALTDDSWRERAACRGQPELFFGPDGERKEGRRVREEQAKAVCYGCPVRRDCLLAAFERNEKAGVWGGVGEGEDGNEFANARRNWQRGRKWEPGSFAGAA